MFSPGIYYRKVPRGLNENLRYRALVVARCKKDVALRAEIREACRRDILFWINTFVFQVNPKHVGREVDPFITWDYQEEGLHRMMDRLLGSYPDDLLLEKSREMGATWVALLLCLWLCLFHQHKRIILISHSEEAVTKASDEGTLFAKIDFILELLPDWMTRGMSQVKKVRRFGTRSTMGAMASTSRSGVGDRATIVLLDEFSKQREGYEIWGQTADTGPRLVIGTHYGLDTCYYDLTQRAQRGELARIVWHWTMHPEKKPGAYRYDKPSNKIVVIDKGYVFPADYRFTMEERPSGGPYPHLRSVWYDRECRRRGSLRDVAMHLDIDPKGSTDQFFDTPIIRSLQEHFCIEPLWQGDLRYDRITFKPIELIPRAEGPLRLWLLPDYRGKMPPSKYAAGGDIATGARSTKSVIAFADTRRRELVAEYADARIEPHDLAALSIALMRLFADETGEGAFFGWEVPGPGLAFGKRVLELGYRNIYYRENEERGYWCTGSTDTPGWFNTVKTSRLLMEDYRAALYKHEFLNRCKLSMEECLMFKYEQDGVVHGQFDLKDDPTGARVNHADRAIAAALCYKMVKFVSHVPAVAAGPPPEPPSVMTLAGRRALAYAKESRRGDSWT